MTVQQPCTSSITQVQRTPYSSLLGNQPAPVYAQPSDCQTPLGPPQLGQAQPSLYGQSGYAQPSPYVQPSYAPGGNVSQAGAIGNSPTAYRASPDGFTVPIPSTAPMTSPLTGLPSAPRPQSGVGDSAPLQQPRLESFRTETSSRLEDQPQYNDPSEPIAPEQTETKPREAAPKSFWQLQEADDSTAMIRRESQTQQPVSLPPPPTSTRPRDPISLTAPSFTAAEPIHAPEVAGAGGYEPSPFENRDTENRGISRANFEAPPLPPAHQPSATDVNSASSRSSWSGTPAREVALVRGEMPLNQAPSRSKPQPKPQPARDARWFTVQPR